MSALSVRISIWTDPPTGPTTYTLGDGSFASGSIAVLQMPDSTTMTGNFTVIAVCHNITQCG